MLPPQSLQHIHCVDLLGCFGVLAVILGGRRHEVLLEKECILCVLSINLGREWGRHHKSGSK